MCIFIFIILLLLLIELGSATSDVFRMEKSQVFD